MSMVIEKKTFCRICEPMCGLIVEVEDGRVTKVRGSKDHLQSRGHICAKAQAAAEMTYDPDRILHPIKRNPISGEFEKISWDTAYSEIAERLTSIRNQHGTDSVAFANGNPASFYASLIMWLGAFKKVMGITWSYAPAAEDTAAPMVAGHLLYGTLGAMLKPDLWRTHFVLIIGANPYVAHSSLFTEPLLREACAEVKEREGRVVVVDPRRTETARRNEHVAINAGTDAWLLSAMLNTIIEEDLVNSEWVQRKTDGLETLFTEVKAITPELAADHTGIEAGKIRQLARDFAHAKSACVLARTGTCTQHFGTLCCLLQNTLCMVTGNIDTEGGMLFGEGLIIEELQRLRNYDDEYQEFPYRLIGQREMLSQNSWLHNVETTMKKGRGQRAKLNPEDAARHGLTDGDLAHIESPWGEIDVAVNLTSDMKPGNIALAHGWGHNGGWQRANKGGGVYTNILTSDRPEDHEKLSATSLLNGVPIRLSFPRNKQPDH